MIFRAASPNLETRDGDHEIDLIIERDDDRLLAVEVELVPNPDPGDLKHLHRLGSQLDNTLLDAVVITTGRHAYRRPDGVAVVPAALLGP